MHTIAQHPIFFLNVAFWIATALALYHVRRVST